MDVLDEIYSSNSVRTANNETIPLHSHITRDGGEFLQYFIEQRPEIARTLEVGCAFGLSSLHICTATQDRKGAHHIICDPSQHKAWRGVGVSNLRRAKFDHFELIERGSQFVLPELAEREPGSFDLVFIDGWHTFDHTLLDIFYANLLVKVGGFVVIDDCRWPSVAKAVSYVSNYPCFEVVDQSRPPALHRAVLQAARYVPKRLFPAYLYDRYLTRLMYSDIVALQKTSADKRAWDWFKPF